MHWALGASQGYLRREGEAFSNQGEGRTYPPRGDTATSSYVYGGPRKFVLKLLGVR